MKKILFSLEEITPYSIKEIMKEQYFVTLIYDPSGGIEELELDEKNILKDITGEYSELSKWVFIGVSPIFKLRRKRKHVFPGGLPLYYGAKKDLISIYLAVMESDYKVRKVGGIFKRLTEQKEMNSLLDATLTLTSLAKSEVVLAKKSFGLMIKALERILINNGDDIDYTNVFTFKESNNYLEGVLQLKSHKFDFKFSVEV